MNKLGTIKLETKRLILRQFIIEDAKAMFNNWANDEEVTRYLMWPVHEDIEVSKKVISSWISQYDNKDYYQWAIILKENGDEPIGSISVVQQNDRIKMVHIGYCIGKQWWSQGITSEAFNEIIRFLMEDVKVNRIESRHDPRNHHSGKVMLKCGLKHEGTRRMADWNNQGICDTSDYAILAEDYFNQRSK